MTELQSSGPARPGDLLDGRYRLEELVGEGGMGSVWRAADEALGRTVAIKIFWAGTTEDADAVRRESEKRLLASVSHPSLVTLFDARLDADARAYLVMEYIDGGTLASLISAGPVRTPDAASLAADLGEALHVVHEAGIIHRDVKPANILLRPPLTPDHTFRAVLADFGIAYLIDSARVTTPGTAIGTAAYISPEQVRGHAPTPASDIYSLGLVLLEALSGQRAFAGRTPVEAISARLTTPPDVPGDWGYGWRSLLTAMTAINPADRPTALEVSVRGRVLDSSADEAELTQAMTAGADSGLVVPPKPPPPAAADLLAEPTKVLAPASADATLVLGSREAGGPASPAERLTVSPARRRWAVIAGGIALVLAAVVVAVVVWNGSGSTPTAPPDLPQVEEPLGTHLQDLMDEVTP
ncbi:serine/threonine-protein kinase [uncultured Microbacterium sp.]|uniref:serine/threonine-protein kinase n=1 Tax=uncultured Microbacterium sp. TaxID=191216 RepID=UPI0028D85514|nr:serine/threonine-protein kinase [uncultured Microbacterium sp.]